MSCDPVLAAMLARPWNNNACRGYVIYAMENCGFSPTDIRRVVAELHEVFDFCGLEEAQQLVLDTLAAILRESGDEAGADEFEHQAAEIRKAAQ